MNDMADKDPRADRLREIIRARNDIRSIPDQIRARRIEAGLTQEQLAEKVGSGQNRVSAWERGVTEPSLSTLYRLSEFLGSFTIESKSGRAGD